MVSCDVIKNVLCGGNFGGSWVQCHVVSGMLCDVM